MNDNEKLIEEQLQKLPVEIRKALEAVPWKEAVKEIGLTNNLSSEQTASLEQETMLILYGFDDPKNYVDNIVREVGINEELALTIAEAVKDKILDPISAKAEELSKNVIHNTLPVIEEGEKVHEVPHDTKLDVIPKPTSTPVTPPTPVVPPVTTPPVSPTGEKLRPHSDTPVEKEVLKTPDYRYPGGADPYREPLQ